MYIKILFCVSLITLTNAQNRLSYISDYLELIDDDFNGLSSQDITFYLYNKKFQSLPNRLLPTDTTIKDVNFTLPIKIIIHGYTHSANKSWVLDMKDAYLQKGDYNVITVDWSEPAKQFYLTSARLTKPVGLFLANLLIHLKKVFGVSYSKFHLIGHSLGAHVSGFAGKYVFQKEKQRLGRITGMDPAGPYFLDKSLYDRLDKSDARFVDVIHTDGMVAGYLPPLGNADFYPNGGIAIQPGCAKTLNLFKFVTCSHSRSFIYFTESINTKEFIGTQCNSFEDYEQKLCTSDRTAVMGENISVKARGIYYLTTNEEPAFARNGMI